jgi:hypothetical protein
MPAIDHCEAQVIRAFEKANWVVTHQPFAIRVHQQRAGYVYADLRLRHQADKQTVIVVEVKCFGNNRTFLDDFYQAVGQYVSYRNALHLNNIENPVYLSIPLKTFETAFQIPLVQAVLADMQMKCVVIDLNKEEIVQWIS